MSRRSPALALAALVLPVLLISIDMTVLGTALPVLAEDLDPGAAEQLWIVDAYSFVLAGLLVTMGTLGDRIGRRRLLMWGAAAFGIASVLAAFAPTAGTLRPPARRGPRGGAPPLVGPGGGAPRPPLVPAAPAHAPPAAPAAPRRRGVVGACLRGRGGGPRGGGGPSKRKIPLLHSIHMS